MATKSGVFGVGGGMMESSSVMCGDLFDHIEDLLDFSSDDVGGLGGGAMVDHCVPTHHHSHDVTDAFPPIMLSPPLPVDGFLVGGSGCVSDGSPGDVASVTALHQEEAKLVPCDDLDITQLEWLSNFFDDSSDSFPLDLPNNDSLGNNGGDVNKTGEDSFFRTSSPVSVLEPNSLIGGGNSSSFNAAPSSSSSSSCSAVGTGGGCGNAKPRATPVSSSEAAVVTIPGRARTKRPRPAAFPPRPHVAMPFLPPSSDLAPLPTMSCSESESFDESDSPPMMIPMKKKKKKNCHAVFAGEETAAAQSPGVRKCMHCEIQKTPQWRAGPMGPKTLCNACGVRYKSGRLFPEYRPAASPTFVPALHSNSHKKVVEMRIKSTQKPNAPAPENPAAKGCDLLEYIRRRD